MSTELLPNIRSRFCDANNVPLAGGKLYTYEAGTTVPLATYTDQAATTPNTNPIILDDNGEAVIFITSGVQYKFVLKDANDVQIWSQDNASGVGFSGNLGTGDVVGPAASVNNEIALLSGTTGKVLKRASGTGYVKATSGVVSYATTIPTSDLTGTLGIPAGGTGQTTAQGAIDALLPTQTGNAGKFVATDGTNSSWGHPLPSGGTSLQILAKNSNTNYDTFWMTNPAYLSVPQHQGTRDVPNDITTDGITDLMILNNYYHQTHYVQGDGGPVTITADPPIAAGGVEGQVLELILRDAAKPITIPDGLTGVDLRGGPLVMDELNQRELFRWDGVEWVLKR